MSKIKIVMDARMIDASGIGVYITNLVGRISTEFDLTLLGDPEKLNHYPGIAGVIPCMAPIYSIKEQTDLPKLIPTCDIFWSPHYNVPLMGVKAKYRVVTIHDVFHLAFYRTLNFKQKLYARLVMNKAIRTSDAIITVSNFSKQELIKYTSVIPDKINVIHNGIRQNAVKEDVQSVREKYHLPENYLLFVGNIKPHKNLKNLLRAYLKLSPDIRDKFKLVITGKKDGFITGDPALVDMIENTPELKDNIRFTGFVEDRYLDALYRAASAFIFPSLYEGFGLPPLEAMLNKCPVTVSNTSSLNEVCGDAAIYFDPLGVSDIANKLREILTNNTLRNSLVARGSERIKLFSWEKAALEHIVLFKQIS